MMQVLAQDGARPATKITRGYTNGEIKGSVLSVMSRKLDNLVAAVERLRADHPDMLLMLDTHVHASVFPDTDKHGNIQDYGLLDMNLRASELQDEDIIQDIVNSTLDFQNGLALNVITSPSLAMQEFNDANAQVSLKMYRHSEQYFKDNETGEKKLYLTIVFSEQALNQTHSMARILDNLCLLDADGFYIVVQRQKNDSPMWSSSDTLARLMYLVNALHEADYEVAVGYTDLWSVLLSAVGADYTASGWFQTLRQYCQDFYRNSRGGPGIPLYVSETLMSTIYTNPDLRNIANNGSLGPQVIDTRYGQALLNNPGQAEWPDEAYALQHWHATKNIISRFGTDTNVNLNTLEGLINSAQTLAGQIRSANITLDERHDARHLGVWKSAIEKYKSGVL